MKILLQNVRFHEDAKIPVTGERGGLSLVRVRGGNEAPVEHEIELDTETQLITIRHLQRDHEPRVFVHVSNTRWMEEFAPTLPPPAPVVEAPAPVNEPEPERTEEAPTVAESPAAARRRRAIGLPGAAANVIIGGPDED